MSAAPSIGSKRRGSAQNRLPRPLQHISSERSRRRRPHRRRQLRYCGLGCPGPPTGCRRCCSAAGSVRRHIIRIYDTARCAEFIHSAENYYFKILHFSCEFGNRYYYEPHFFACTIHHLEIHSSRKMNLTIFVF